LEVFNYEIMKPLFDILDQTKGVTQMSIWHPEGDVLSHSLQVMDIAFKESIDTDLILAGMLHDVGKVVNSKGHDKIAVEWLDDLISVKTSWLIENHMRFWAYIMGEMKKHSKVQELANYGWLPELTMLARWDKIGRNPNKQVKYDKMEIIDRLNRCVDKHFEINKRRKDEDKSNQD